MLEKRSEWLILLLGNFTRDIPEQFRDLLEHVSCRPAWRPVDWFSSFLTGLLGFECASWCAEGKTFGKYLSFGPKSDPKKGTWNVQKRTLFDFLHGLFDMFLRLFFGSKMNGKWVQQGGPTCVQKSWKIYSLAAVQFWSDLGSIVDRF